MENASKALLMAAGILIGVLILTLMAILFLAGNEVFSGYEETKTAEMVQRFNTNFTKYTGHKITAHEALTIYNFAKSNEVNKVKVNISDDLKTTKQLGDDISGFTGTDATTLKKYRLTINGYTEDGYIKEITIY